MKMLATLALLLAVVGCGGPCHDLVETKYIVGVPVGDMYYECMKGCCKEAPKTPRECSCSNHCPCWGRHTEETKFVGPEHAMPAK